MSSSAAIASSGRPRIVEVTVVRPMLVVNNGSARAPEMKFLLSDVDVDVDVEVKVLSDD